MNGGDHVTWVWVVGVCLAVIGGLVAILLAALRHANELAEKRQTEDNERAERRHAENTAAHQAIAAQFFGLEKTVGMLAAESLANKKVCDERHGGSGNGAQYHIHGG